MHKINQYQSGIHGIIKRHIDTKETISFFVLTIAFIGSLFYCTIIFLTEC